MSGSMPISLLHEVNEAGWQPQWWKLLDEKCTPYNSMPLPAWHQTCQVASGFNSAVSATITARKHGLQTRQHTTGTFGKLVDLCQALSTSLPNKMLLQLSECGQHYPVMSVGELYNTCFRPAGQPELYVLQDQVNCNLVLSSSWNLQITSLL